MWSGFEQDIKDFALARFLGCNQVALFGRALILQRQLSVQRQGRLQRDEGAASSNPAGKSVIEMLCFGLTRSSVHRYASRAEYIRASACHFWIWILCRGDDPRD